MTHPINSGKVYMRACDRSDTTGTYSLEISGKYFVIVLAVYQHGMIVKILTTYFLGRRSNRYMYEWPYTVNTISLKH